MPEIKDAAVKKATGKNWAEWFALLDKAGAKNWPHKQIAQWLRDQYGEYMLAFRQAQGHSTVLRNINLGGSPRATVEWWCQGVTVAYEKARGLRVLGETKDSGFEIGVQKTLELSPEEAWKFITSPQGLKIWLGEGVELKFEPGETYATKDGTIGQIRTIHEGERLRLTWQPKNWAKPSTLQIYFMPTGSKTSLRFHQEKLADAKTRAQMKQHWQKVLEKLSS